MLSLSLSLSVCLPFACVVRFPLSQLVAPTTILYKVSCSSFSSFLSSIGGAFSFTILSSFFFALLVVVAVVGVVFFLSVSSSSSSFSSPFASSSFVLVAHFVAVQSLHRTADLSLFPLWDAATAAVF
jgi:hypothetical protein